MLYARPGGGGQNSRRNPGNRNALRTIYLQCCAAAPRRATQLAESPYTQEASSNIAAVQPKVVFSTFVLHRCAIRVSIRTQAELSAPAPQPADQCRPLVPAGIRCRVRRTPSLSLSGIERRPESGRSRDPGAPPAAARPGSVPAKPTVAADGRSAAGRRTCRERMGTACAVTRVGRRRVRPAWIREPRGKAPAAQGGTRGDGAL